MPRDSQPCAN